MLAAVLGAAFLLGYCVGSGSVRGRIGPVADDPMSSYSSQHEFLHTLGQLVVAGVTIPEGATCWACGGTGSFVCALCEGRDPFCMNCDGTGRIDCPLCE